MSRGAHLKRIPDHVVAEIRQRAANKLPWGAQKVIAYDLGLTTSYVNQVIRNYRRKTT